MVLKFNDFINKTHIDEVQQGVDVTTYRWDANTADLPSFDVVFRIYDIDDSTMDRMLGKSYPSGCQVSRDDLKYLIVAHYDGKGYIRLGELVCHKDVSKEFMYLFKELFHNRYPIEKMVLIDNYDGNDKRSMSDNNTSAFNYRMISGTDKLSKHAFGMAIDINPLYNPYVKGTYVSPPGGEPYVDRDKSFKYKLEKGDLVYRILHDKLGFEWGGDWESCKDYQHYEK